jgi:hypothetical protein
VEQFYKIVDELNEIKTSMRKYQVEIDKRGLDIPFPQTDHVAFTEALHAEDMELFAQAGARVAEGEKVKNMLIGQESLCDILEHEARSINLHLVDHQVKQKQMENDSKEGGKELNKLQRYYEETER